MLAHARFRTTTLPLSCRARNKRRHRINFNDPGHAHPLNFCCDHNFPCWKAERTCEWLRDAIDEAREKLNFALWAYEPVEEP